MAFFSSTDKSISERNYFGPAKTIVSSEDSQTTVSKEDTLSRYQHDSSSLIVYFSFLIIIIFGLFIHVILKWRLNKKLRKTPLPISTPPGPNKSGHLYLQYHSHNHKCTNFELRPFIVTKNECLKCTHDTKCNLMIRA